MILNGNPLKQPPEYCEYANGPCDQSFDDLQEIQGLFLYPSDPLQIASTIETAVEQLRVRDDRKQWLTWKDLSLTDRLSFVRSVRRCDFLNV